jgi:adenylosuccinate lyase
MARYEEYTSPFTARYSSKEMSHLFSPKFKITTFRKLWASLAKAQKKLGLPITHQQVAQLEDNVEKIDFELALKYEKKFRHDVMAHIHAFGDQCPDARPIIHLGATSSFVTDNTDLIQLKKGLELIFQKLLHILKILSTFAEKEAATPCVGYTHFQPAQPTTVGKRAAMWLQDFFMDAKEIERHLSLPFLGVKGATGTQASFLALFENDSEKVFQLETLVAKDFGFDRILPIAGQTYTRKIDLNILNTLESFASSAHKMATDIRLLAHDNELSEAFAEEQVGSSAMPHKQNPIYCERICGLSRFVISLAQNPAYTAATQWLERTLDDSSNRRLAIPEAFLGTDAILNLLSYLIPHLTVNREQSSQHLEREIPHIALEGLLIAAAKKGADRQKVHETLRKMSGRPLLEIAEALGLEALPPEVSTGLATEQVQKFVRKEVYPFLESHKHQLQAYSDLVAF